MSLSSLFKGCNTNEDIMKLVFELSQASKYSREEILKEQMNRRKELASTTTNTFSTFNRHKSKFIRERQQYFPNIYKEGHGLRLYEDGSIDV